MAYCVYADDSFVVVFHLAYSVAAFKFHNMFLGSYYPYSNQDVSVGVKFLAFWP